MRVACWSAVVALGVTLGLAGTGSAAGTPETQISWYGFAKFDLPMTRRSRATGISPCG